MFTFYPSRFLSLHNTPFSAHASHAIIMNIDKDTYLDRHIFSVANSAFFKKII